jgi:sugar O-acyltransferase (sialic acid O-acetyltransferase NeuD family)
VHGRNDIPWAERIEHDLYYVDHYSLGLDLRILARTLRVLAGGGGVYAASGANDGFAAVSQSTLTDAGNDVPGRSFSPAAAADPAPQLLPLLVIGAGGHARVLVDIAEKQGRYRIAGLLDDRAQMRGTEVLGYPVLGGREVLERDDAPAHAIVAIGAPRARAAWQAHLEDRGFQLAVLVHPTASVARGVEIGAGSVLMAGAIVNPGSRLGRGVIVNTGASVDHDCDVGDFTHIAPGARLAGGVRVGPRSHVGLQAGVIQNVVVGADVTVGAGAAVIRPVPDGVTVAGVPARALPSRAPAHAVV